MGRTLGMLVCCLFFALLVGCGEVTTELATMDATEELSDQIQSELNKMEAKTAQKVEIDKILAADPNMTDKEKMTQALADFQRLDKHIIPQYEKMLMQIKANAAKWEKKYVSSAPTAEVKTLNQQVIQGFVNMVDAESAYVEAAKKSSKLEGPFFSKMLKGEEPTEAEVEAFNQNLVAYNKAAVEMDAKIGAFNVTWEKLVQRSGQVIEK